MATINKDFDTSHLNDEQRKIAEIILKAAFGDSLEDASGGGCRAFYTPQEWHDQKEDYGTESKLIIVYDGGDLSYYMNMDKNYSIYLMMRDEGVEATPYASYEKVRKALEEAGYMVEECTSWYSAVYKA